MDDAGEIYAVDEQREGSTSAAAGCSMFSRSPSTRREVDDDDLLTYGRSAMPEGTELREAIDVGDDYVRLLYKFKERLDRVGIKLPTIEVRYKNLNVEAESYVGSRGVPTILNTYANILENDLAIRFSWLWKNITVVGLGWNTPVNRKSTFFMLFIFFTTVSGMIAYNGNTMDKFIPQRSAAYVSQHDVHIAELTVRETINLFYPQSVKELAITMVRPEMESLNLIIIVSHHIEKLTFYGKFSDLLLELLRREEEENITPDSETDIYLKVSTTGEEKAEVVTNHILKILGLDICGHNSPNIDVAAEMLVTLGRTLFMDEISNGLDSSTTFQIVDTIQQTIRILACNELFDDIILLSDGQVVYSGPRDHVFEFFKSLGFKCPERKGVADFLQEVTSRKDQKQYWIHGDDTYRYIPVTVFAEAFQCFHVGQAIRSELAVPFDKSKSHPAALKTSKHGVNLKELLKASIDREILLLKIKSFLYIFNALQLTLVAIIAMIVFIRTNMHHDSIENRKMYMGVQFFSMLVIMFKGLAEMGLALAKLPVFFKQRDLLFYPAWTYSLPSWIIKTPISFLNTIIWVSITYYVIGFEPNIGRCFRQLLVLFVMSEAICGLFRFIAALTRHPVVASTVSEFCILIVMVSSGFILSRDEVKKWLIWEYWASPLMYALNALAVNEFLGPSWNETLLGFREPLGRLVLESRGVFPEVKWYWIGLGALLGYVLLFNILYTICLSILTSRKQILLPFVPISMTFEDIRYSVDMPKAWKVQGMTESRLELLKDISGSFRLGVLTALMGISGAGKTTLLDVLAGRKTNGHIHGNITISSYPKKQETFSRVSGCCEQNDIHSPNLTVYESLMFTAWLRLPAKIDSMTRKRFIDEFMELVELFPLKDALVGLPGVSGLSTEQRKRLTIAVELVANPSIIFMDEPTSGRCTSSSHCVRKIKHGYNPSTWMLENSSSVQPVVTIERTVFYRERASHMYSPLPYALGQVVIELPYIFLQTLIYGVIVYSMMGYEWTSTKYFWYMFFMYFTLSYFRFYGMMVAGLTPNCTMSSIRIPAWWRWYYWICLVAWTINGLVTSQFGDVDDKFDNGVRVSDFVESYFGYNLDLLWVAAMAVISFAILFAILFGLSLRLFNFQKR
uniref:ABC transporter domain-containing protein n=1 Tax=Oryza punctata TaxID=4537 RepID=A0A0E0LZZ7_ORYPU